MAQDAKSFLEKNRQVWNQYTGFHLKSDFYDLPSFQQGKSSLHSTELEELESVKGKTILHLQCHFGQDTLSLERLGAKCTGIDISDESIKEAKNLAAGLKLNSQFIQSDIYDLKNNLKEKESYDVVFTSYGVLFWLPDLIKWAELIYSLLKEGGKFYIIEIHPFLETIDEDFRSFKYPYFRNTGNNPLKFVETGTYADKDAPISAATYGWPHPIGEVTTALCDAGLQIQFLHEFPFCHYNILPDMIEISEDKFYHNEIKDRIPYMFSIMATKT
jgi:2-polyprenyl-3-methyl-5-hydroxy-6-metoxy-1,4-benzoquinol methylase